METSATVRQQRIAAVHRPSRKFEQAWRLGVRTSRSSLFGFGYVFEEKSSIIFNLPTSSQPWSDQMINSRSSWQLKLRRLFRFINFSETRGTSVNIIKYWGCNKETSRRNCISLPVYVSGRKCTRIILFPVNAALKGSRKVAFRFSRASRAISWFRQKFRGNPTKSGHIPWEQNTWVMSGGSSVVSAHQVYEF